MSIQFTQPQVEQELDDVVPHGRREDVARITGIYPEIVRAYFCPTNERKSPQYTTLAIQAALDELDLAVGDAHWKKMCAMREASKPHNFKPATLCVERELGNLSKEITDVIVAKCEGRPVVEQLREIGDAERQIAKYKDAVFAQIGKTRDAVEAVN